MAHLSLSFVFCKKIKNISVNKRRLAVFGYAGSNLTFRTLRFLRYLLFKKSILTGANRRCPFEGCPANHGLPNFFSCFFQPSWRPLMCANGRL